MKKLKLKLAKLAIKYLKKEILSLLKEFIHSLVMKEVLEYGTKQLSDIEAKVFADLYDSDKVIKKIENLSQISTEKLEEIEVIKEEINSTIVNLINDYINISNTSNIFKKEF